MNDLPRVGISSLADFRNHTMRLRSYQAVTAKAINRQPKASAESLLQIHYLREALSAIKPGRIQEENSRLTVAAAAAISSQPLDFNSNATTTLRSVEEINTAPTSFQHNGPAWIGSTTTAPWSGLGSTAAATVSGSYDGSDGQGTLRFEVDRAGTHGQDDLKIRVFNEAGDRIDEFKINKEDPLNRAYAMSNGIEITLGVGELVKQDYFEVDLSILSTSYTPDHPDWSGSTASPAIGGLYLGSQGSGDLTFRVDRAGVHGKDDLKIKVFGPDDSLIETIDIKKNDAIDQVYLLTNGLTFTLGEGEILKGETFRVAVEASNPANYSSTPSWNTSAAKATLTGTYDGSNGTDALTFEILDNGIHGEDDVRVTLNGPDGSKLGEIEIKKNDPIDQGYDVGNGLTITFAAGDFIKNETFTLEVESQGNFSTTPNPVTSTAAPAIQGVYDGSLGTDVLEFLVTQAGIHGSNDLAFEVRTSDGTLVDTISLNSIDPMDQVYSLSSGLEFQLGDGRLTLGESFTVNISHLVPTSVDPQLSFDGTGIFDAKLEDPFVIEDGSFQLNGNSIAVFANDSISSVLDRINNAGMDVTATFDAASETILMSRQTPGSELDIVLNQDSSGFLAAMKLTTANSTAATYDETTVLKNLEFMSGVTSGLLSVNGVSIGINVETDSLEDVLARIETWVPDLAVDFDADSGRVSFLSTNLKDLQISSGGTGFFAAVGIDEGLYPSVEGREHPHPSQRFFLSDATRHRASNYRFRPAIQCPVRKWLR